MHERSSAEGSLIASAMEQPADGEMGIMSCVRVPVPDSWQVR